MRNSSKLGNDPVSQIWLVLLFVHFHQWIKKQNWGGLGQSRIQWRRVGGFGDCHILLKHGRPSVPITFNQNCSHKKGSNLTDTQCLSGTILSLSLLSWRSAFSRPFKDRCMSEVARIGSLIIFHLSKAMKSQILHTMSCNISGEVAGERWDRSLLGVKRVKWCQHSL